MQSRDLLSVANEGVIDETVWEQRDVGVRSLVSERLHTDYNTDN